MEHLVAFPIPSHMNGKTNMAVGEYDDLQNLLDMTSHEKPPIHIETDRTNSCVLKNFAKY